MILVLIFIFVILLTLLIFVFSTIRISIINLEFGNYKVNTVNEKYKVNISLYFLEKIKILSINLNNKKMKKILTNKQLEKIDLEKVKRKIPINKETLNILRKINIKIKKLNMRIDIGTESVILTSYLVGAIATVISIILPHLISGRDIEKCRYSINPIYREKNEYHIYLDSIIQIKIVHIIYVIFNLLMKGSSNNERTSNRRSYGYSYEQH